MSRVKTNKFEMVADKLMALRAKIQEVRTYAVCLPTTDATDLDKMDGWLREIGEIAQDLATMQDGPIMTKGNPFFDEVRAKILTEVADDVSPSVSNNN